MTNGPATHRRVVFLTDVITPYMVAVLRALSEIVDLMALFCSERGTRSADWDLRGRLGFDHRVIGGVVIRRKSIDATDFYPSPRIPLALAREHPEAVISGGFSFPSIYAGLYCRAAGAGFVVHSDGTSASEDGLNPVQRASRPLVLGLAGACAANSEPAAKRFVELGFAEDRVFRALHSTDVCSFWEAGQTRRERSGPTRVLAVGRLIPRKGFDRLIRAAALSRSRGADIELVLVGSGPEEESLRRLAAELGLEPIDFRGFVDQPQLPALYAEADVFAFPSLDDPFGMVLLEAAAAGLPLIASTRAGATGDLVEEGRNGHAVDPDDLEGMAAAIERLAADGALRQRMGRAAYESTLSRTPADAARGYLEAAEMAIAVRRGLKVTSTESDRLALRR